MLSVRSTVNGSKRVSGLADGFHMDAPEVPHQSSSPVVVSRMVSKTELAATSRTWRRNRSVERKRSLSAASRTRNPRSASHRKIRPNFLQIAQSCFSASDPLLCDTAFSAT